MVSTRGARKRKEGFNSYTLTPPLAHFSPAPCPPLKFLSTYLLVFFTPGNLLVTKDCQLRITDFGLARAWDAAPPNASDNEAAVGAMTE